MESVLCSWTGSLRIAKMWIFPSWIHRFNVFPANYADIDKLILTFIGKGKRPRIACPVPKKNNGAGLPLPNFKACYKFSKIKTAWYCRKNRQINRTE